MKVFISGSKSIAPYCENGQLPERVLMEIDKYIAAGDSVLIGDCPGADARVQQYLHRKNYRNVTVYVSGEQGQTRINEGKWDEKHVLRLLAGNAEMREVKLKQHLTKQLITSGQTEWIILAKEGDRALLLSKDYSEKRAYHLEEESVTWETCSLRSYLNGPWYEKFFSEGEKEKILTTKVKNPDNSKYGTSGGNDTKDRVFLLSIDEVLQYFSSDRERVTRFNGVPDDWWLRSPGVNGSTAAFVTDGFIANRGDYVEIDYGVRPALWIKLDSYPVTIKSPKEQIPAEPVLA